MTRTLLFAASALGGEPPALTIAIDVATMVILMTSNTFSLAVVYIVASSVLNEKSLTVDAERLRKTQYVLVTFFVLEIITAITAAVLASLHDRLAF